jgi:AcrR family transcriptional regulator
VRRAVLDAASALFAARGVDRVSLRDIAAAADVSLALINRYMGSRDELVGAVLDDLSDQVARSLRDTPLQAQDFDPDSALGRFVRVFGALAIAGQPLVGRVGFNPVLVLAHTIEDAYGLDPQAARIRAAQSSPPHWAGEFSRATSSPRVNSKRCRSRCCATSTSGPNAGSERLPCPHRRTRPCAGADPAPAHTKRRHQLSCPGSSLLAESPT